MTSATTLNLLPENNPETKITLIQTNNDFEINLEQFRLFIQEGVVPRFRYLGVDVPVGKFDLKEKMHEIRLAELAKEDPLADELLEAPSTPTAPSEADVAAFPFVNPEPVSDMDEIVKTIKIWAKRRDSETNGRVIIELRGIEKNGLIWSGYYDNSAKLTKHALELAAKPNMSAVYLTLNRIDPSLFDRRPNEYRRVGTGETTSDSHITRRVWVLIDADTERPEGVPAKSPTTKEEKSASFQAAKDIREFILSEAGIKSLLADSGNGTHAMVAVDLPNDRETKDLIDNFLRALKERTTIPGVKIDLTVSNAARICKLYGTITRKGENTEERPWRLSRMLECLDIEVATAEQLQKIAGLVKNPSVSTEKKSTERTKIRPETMEKFCELAKFDLIKLKDGTTERKTLSPGKYMWIFKHCPFNEEHTGTSCALILHPDGPGFECKHDGCVDNHWEQFKALGLSRIPGHAFSFVLPEDVDVEPWREPTMFEMGLPPVLPFEITCLPHCLRALVIDVAERVGVPIEFTASAAIAALSAVVNRRAFVYPKEYNKKWKESLNTWGAITAGPGEKKTPAMNEMFIPLYRIREEWNAQNKKAWADYQKGLEACKAQDKNDSAAKKARDRRTKGGSSTVVIADEPESAAEFSEGKIIYPEEPTKMEFMVNDVTSEYLQDTNAMNPEGIFVLRDEQASWVAELDAKGQESKRGVFLTGWSGNTPYDVGRMGRDGNLAVLCFSMFGGFQPQTLRKFLESGLEVEDGLFPRFQNMVWPNPLDAETAKGVDRAANEDAIIPAEKMLRALVGMKVEQVDLHFAKGRAQQMFNDWSGELQDKIFKEPLSHIKQHLAKYAGFMPILAALFQLADLVTNQEQGQMEPVVIAGRREIDAEHVEQAIRLVRILESHMHRVYSCVKNPFLLAKETLAKHILGGDLENVFKPRDVLRKGWSGLKDEKLVEISLETLEDLGWIRGTGIPPGPKGGRPTIRWEINPALKLAKREVKS